MRSHRAVLNFIFSLARNFMGVLLGLVTTPLILKYLGEERFGAFRILLDWLSHMGVLEFGLYSASLALLTKASVEGRESMRATLRLIFKNYFVVFVLQVTAYIFLYYFVDRLIPVSREIQGELRLATIIMAISLFFLISQIFKAYLESLQKGYVVSLILMIFNITYLCFSTTGAVLGYGLPGQAVSYVLSLLISLIIFSFFSKSLWSDFFSQTETKENSAILKKQRFSHFSNELCARIALLSDNIIVSIFMGAHVVTAFFITQKVSGMIQQQLQHISNSSWAALSELHFQKKHDIFKERILQLTEVIAYFSGVTLSVCCILNPSFISLWTGADTFSGVWVSNLSSINAGFFSLLSLWSWCFTATNLTNKLVPLSIAQAVVNLSASLILTKYYGVIGPLAGTLISFVGVSVGWKSWLICKTFQINFTQLTMSWVRPMLPPLILVLAYMQMFGPLLLTSWLQIIFAGFVITSLIFGVSFFVLIRRSTQDLLKLRIQQTLSRFFAAK